MTITDTKERITTTPFIAPTYKVLLWNDEKTTFEFVVAILIEVFEYEYNDAVIMTRKIHESSKSVVGEYTYEIAEQKQHDVMSLAKQAGFPLTATIEQ